MATATMNGKQPGKGGQRGPRGGGQRGGGQGGNTRTKPVHVIRMGSLKAAVWENQIPQGTIHNVTVGRTYKVDEEYRESQSFGFDDLLPLAKALNAAHSWINDQRAKQREKSKKQQGAEDGSGADEAGSQGEPDENP